MTSLCSRLLKILVLIFSFRLETHQGNFQNKSLEHFQHFLGEDVGGLVVAGEKRQFEISLPCRGSGPSAVLS
jgi:hypothetical protein